MESVFQSLEKLEKGSFKVELCYFENDDYYEEDEEEEALSSLLCDSSAFDPWKRNVESATFAYQWNLETKKLEHKADGYDEDEDDDEI